MTYHSAIGIEATTAGARILTLRSYASFVRCTVARYRALGSAALVRISVEIRSAGARGCVVGLTTNRVRSAGRGLAGSIRWSWPWRCQGNGKSITLLFSIHRSSPRSVQNTLGH